MPAGGYHSLLFGWASGPPARCASWLRLRRIRQRVPRQFIAHVPRFVERNAGVRDVARDDRAHVPFALDKFGVQVRERERAGAGLAQDVEYRGFQFRHGFSLVNHSQASTPSMMAASAQIPAMIQSSAVMASPAYRYRSPTARNPAAAEKRRRH